MVRQQCIDATASGWRVQVASRHTLDAHRSPSSHGSFYMQTKQWPMFLSYGPIRVSKACSVTQTSDSSFIKENEIVRIARPRSMGRSHPAYCLCRLTRRSCESGRNDTVHVGLERSMSTDFTALELQTKRLGTGSAMAKAGIRRLITAEYKEQIPPPVNIITPVEKLGVRIASSTSLLAQSSGILGHAHGGWRNSGRYQQGEQRGIVFQSRKGTGCPKVDTNNDPMSITFMLQRDSMLNELDVS